MNVCSMDSIQPQPPQPHHSVLSSLASSSFDVVSPSVPSPLPAQVYRRHCFVFYQQSVAVYLKSDNELSVTLIHVNQFVGV